MAIYRNGVITKHGSALYTSKWKTLENIVVNSKLCGKRA